MDSLSSAYWKEKKRIEEAGGVEAPWKGSTKVDSLNSMIDYVEQSKNVDLAPLYAKQQEREKEKERTWFDTSVFDDGISVENILKALLGTTTDAVENIGTGGLGLVETFLDTAAWLSPAATTAQQAQNDMNFQFDIDAYKKMQDESAELIKKDLIDEESIAKTIITNPVKAVTGVDAETDSLFGEKIDSIAQSGGQLLARAGLQMVGVPWWVTLGASSFGGEVEASLNEGASYNQAGAKGAIAVGTEILSEKLFGGSGLGEKGLFDLDPLTRGISNKLVKTLADYGVDMVAEGAEEVVAEVAGNLSDKLHKEESVWELLTNEEALNAYLESFVGGFILGGFGNAKKAAKSAKQGTDYRSDFTLNEQKVVDAVYNKKLEQSGKLTAKQKSKLYNQVANEMERGRISVEEIESVLGGEKYTNFKSGMDNFFGSDDYKSYKDISKRIEEIQTEMDALGSNTKPTLKESKRYDKLDAELEKLTAQRDSMKTKLDAEATRIKGLRTEMRDGVIANIKDSRLMESYNEFARKQQKYEVDVNQYENENARKTVQAILDSGLGDNSNQFHETVDFLARISADKGVFFDLTNNEKLMGTEHYKEGYTTNGYVTDDGTVVLNMDSDRALYTTVGHEITHTLEKAGVYGKLAEAVRSYAISKEGLEAYNKRIQEAEAIYKGKKNTTAEKEVASDLIGQYLFEDTQFVNELSVKDQNVFEWMFDQIKYLCKVVTAGSKEERELLKVKKLFTQAYQQNIKKSEANAKAKVDKMAEGVYQKMAEEQAKVDKIADDVRKQLEKETPIDPVNDEDLDYESPAKYSISVKDQNTIDFLENQEHITTYKAMVLIDGKLYPPMATKVKDENGKYQLTNGRELGEWMQAEEDTTNIKFNDKGVGYYVLKKDAGTDVKAAYNPYEHSSNLMLNDQFEAAYKRGNLVTVECVIPKSELTSGYKAQYAKDSTGMMDWHSGVVAGKLKDNKRSVYLSRYLKATRIVPDSEVAQHYKEIVGDMAVPFNVVSPSLLTELENAGVNIDYNGTPGYQSHQRRAAEKEAKEKAKESVKTLEGGSVVKYSLSTWTPEMQSKVSDNLVKAGYDKADVDKWIKDTNSIAAMIAEDKARLDFEAHENHTMVKDNLDYYKTVEASTLCAKRLKYQGTFDAIQHRLPNTTLTSDMLIELREMMKKNGHEVPCGACYVESRRRHLGKFATEWLKNYSGEYIPTLADVTTTNGLEALRHEHPDTYNDFVTAMKKKGVANPKVVELRTEYRGEIMKISNATYKKIMKIGGLRLQSFSDFETPHLLDMMQVVNDMASRRFVSQAYTKVPNFAWVLGDTNIKINLSLIPSGTGVDTNGNLTFDPKEGMDIDEAMRLRDRYSKNVGTTIIGINDEHILKCMADDRIDYIIPFHRSGWGAKELSAMGLDSYTDYQDVQKERDIKTGKGTPNIDEMSYWDFSKTGKENAETYLAICAEKGVIPKFDKFLVDNGDGSYSLQPDGSTDGYWKTLINFKMYDNDGVGSPHQTVVPNFNMEEARRVLNEYEGGANSLPVANDVVEEFVKKYKENIGPVKYSLTKDSDGNQLTTEQQEFFKDTKITDDNGNLIPLYHGTGSDFTVFDVGRSGQNYDGWSELGQGIYLTPKKATAEYFADNAAVGRNTRLMHTYANIKNPFNSMEAVEFSMEDLKEKYQLTDFDISFMQRGGYRLINFLNEHGENVRDYLMSKGHDGVWDKYYDNLTQVVAFNSNQVKNIDNVSPTDNPDIRYSMSKQQDYHSYMEAVNSGDTDTAQELLDGFAKDAGYNYRGVHRSFSDFTVFDRSKIGSNAGTRLGDGFYVTLEFKDEATARYADDSYGKNKMDLYVKMESPLVLGTPFDENFVNKMEEDFSEFGWFGEDSFSTYAVTPEKIKKIFHSNDGYEQMETIRLIANRNQMEISELLKQYGFDSIIDENDYVKQAVVFDETQLKSAEPVTYDGYGDVIMPYERFSQDNMDIRYSMSEEGDMSPYGYIPSRDIGYTDPLADFGPVRDDIPTGEKTVEPTIDAPIADEPKDTVSQRRLKNTEHTEFWKNLLGDTSTWTDLKTGLAYKTKTLRRILRRVVKDANGNADFKKADAIYDALETKYDHNEALLKRESKRLKEVFFELNLNHTEDQYAQMLGELHHNPDTTLTPDVVNKFYQQNKNKIDEEKVKKAIKEARKLYDELIVRVNNVLNEQGFREIPYRQGYFPHFTNPKQNWFQKMMNWKPVNNEIPTSIAGLTEMFKPNRTWQSFDKHRIGDKTDYSLNQGLDTYIHGALDWIYHIDDLQSRRALENHIRYIHSEKGVQEKIDKIRASNLDADEAQQQIDAVLAEANNPLGGLVRELMNRTNTLANKKSSMDRGVEDLTNRKIYSTMTNINNRITANQVVGSLSSAMTNFIPMVQSWHQVSPWYTVKGLGDFVRATIKDDGMVQKSDFLTNRLMEEEKLFQSNWDKVSDKAAFMMNVADNITSQTVWRSKYYQNLSEGMSENQAIKDADQFAKNLMAGRSRGNAPTIFDAKNPFVKIFTAFQLEVANQYGYMFEDVPQDSQNKARLVKGYATAFIGAHLYNALYSSMVGRDAAFDPIEIFQDLMHGLLDDEEEDEDVLFDFGRDILEEVPFVGGLLGGGRIPMSSAIPYSGEDTPLENFFDDWKLGREEGNWRPLWNQLMKPLMYFAMPTGGGQLKKTIEGLGMFSDEHPIAGSYTESGNLRFPVEDTFGSRVQAALFGQYSSENARKYFDEGHSTLNADQTAIFAELGIPIEDYWEYKSNLDDFYDTRDELKTEANAKTATDEDILKYKYINALYSDINELYNKQKEIVYGDSPNKQAELKKIQDEMSKKLTSVQSNLDDIYVNGYYAEIGDKRFDYSDYSHNWYEVNGEYLEKEQKAIERYGITPEQYWNDQDKYYHADYYFQYNAKLENVSKNLFDGEWFASYASEVSQIKGDDNNGDGKTDSGSKKKKIFAYIDSLDVSDMEKNILRKMSYSSEKKNNRDIAEYIVGRVDLTYQQKKEVLTGLGFKVDEQGYITW